MAETVKAVEALDRRIVARTVDVRSAEGLASVANAAAWLVSDGAFAVTGQAIAVDPGHTALPGFNSPPND